MKERKRINISVDGQLYDRLRYYQERYGFKNICEFNVAMLNVLVTHLDAMARLSDSDPDTDIVDVFNDMADYERDRVKKRNNDYSYGKG